MMLGRNTTEARLTAMYENQDGTTKDWQENVNETTYERLNTRYNNFNRAMFTVYAQFLITDLQPEVRTAGIALTMTAEGASEEPRCPYSHIRDLPIPPPTVPQFDPLIITDTTQHALLTQRLRPAMRELSPNTVWAVADSGASHILIRKADVHVLTEVQYSPASLPPFAVLNTANGDPLQAIGKGILAVGSLRLPAYVFKTRDLVNNLVGLAPFADRSCTAIFKPASLQIFPH